MLRSVITLAALCLVLAACGDDETSGATVTTVGPSTTMAATPSTAITTTVAPATTTTNPPTTTTTTTEPPPEPFEAVDVVFDLQIDGTSTVSAGTFTASGPAVEEGLICSSGTTFEASWEQTGAGELWETRFKCDDGSGNFSIEVLDTGDWEDGAWVHSGAWTWVSDKGNGSYIGVSGEGMEEGVCADGTCTEKCSGEIMRTG